MEKIAVCLLSGGMDSAVASAIAKEEGYKLHAITFDYGQRNKKEMESARQIAEWLKAVHKILKADLRQIGGSALTDEIEVPEEGRGIPPTYVPARNTIFLSYALAYAEVIEAEAIFIGVNSVDYSGYPDCRPEYIEAFQKLANLATKRGVEGYPVKIKAPLLYLSKVEIVKKGVELGVPFEKTWSCYRESEKACGRCDSCRLRMKAFEEAGIEDPIEYE
ncbi:7-cyano-7-deazaguanine synthase QueC [Thermoplasmatales archaeon ex4484_30]|nr:MAG: 7-cyano-7-deazaguanine synthase QueC [Thermoplasmata archaeon]OYT61156.1 MAG: 7-cyano-7-deazaguanine synthase QueC [Thermoplasmatales archaeon ex4484_30]